MSTFTVSSTYTVTDVRKVLDRMAADLHMIAQATGLLGGERVAQVSHDVKLMAERGYIDRVDIVLRNGTGADVRANKYRFSKSASGWSNDRPGDNLWPRQVSGDVHIVVSYTNEWWALSDYQRSSFLANECMRPWGPSEIDTSYPGMVGRVDRHYASNAFGAERTVYEGSG